MKLSAAIAPKISSPQPFGLIRQLLLAGAGVVAAAIPALAQSGPLGLTFYNASAFPAEYHGDGFAAEHGSWNRAKRTGYKVIRVRMKDGVPTGEYQDFMTGFVVGDSDVWGRPVGVTVTRDGALLVSEDGNGTIWRITH